MPWASQKQRGKLYAMLARGEIGKATVDEFDRASKGKKLPMRAGKRGILSQLYKGKKGMAHE